MINQSKRKRLLPIEHDYHIAFYQYDQKKQQNQRTESTKRAVCKTVLNSLSFTGAWVENSMCIAAMRKTCTLHRLLTHKLLLFQILSPVTRPGKTVLMCSVRKLYASVTALPHCVLAKLFTMLPISTTTRQNA